jgi:hypothetical protein
MSLLSVVKDVCMANGLAPPASMFGTSTQPRTQAELLSLANETAQKIAYDVREWRALKSIATITGDGVADRFALPADFKRMLLTSQVYPSASTNTPLKFVPDANEWLLRRINNRVDGWGEWTIIGDDMLIFPILQAAVVTHPASPAQQVTFAYLNKNCIRLAGGGYGDQFTNDGDVFRIDERLLKLGMVWQWKANKGSPYAEDMGTYSDALVNIAGADTPAPIIVDSGWDRGWTRVANANIIQQ